MNRCRTFILVLLVGFGSDIELHAQSQEKMYATLILNIARGMQWPDKMQNGQLVISVFEYEPLAEELKRSASGLNLSGKKVLVNEISSLESIPESHILFLPAFKARALPQLIASVNRAPILIVTNKPGMASQGSGVNFVLLQGKLKYEINCKSIEARGIKISSAIKGMGINVE